MEPGLAAGKHYQEFVVFGIHAVAAMEPGLTAGKHVFEQTETCERCRPQWSPA